MASSKVYRSLLQELGEWISTAKDHHPKPINAILQQTAAMSAPPPSPTHNAEKFVSTTHNLDKLHDRLRTVLKEQFQVIEQGKQDEIVLQKHRDAAEILTYLRSQRTYKVLLDKYNPTATLEDHERIRLTARRVGLELPKEIQQRFKNEDEPESSTAEDPDKDKKKKDE
ncbi:hypothetical protein V1514DRAFT_280344 [Lipomyces japonicus]|uniref:uncharacterized protein n=1 Tax=Lipomyces japonicus TaxID=56871 RepID=UPI0034CE006C